MTTLPDVLTAPDVEVIDLRTTVDASDFESRWDAVMAAENRAAAAAIRDRDGRLLLTRDANRSGAGWRLPGTDVGAVSDLTGRLTGMLAAGLGLQVPALRPRWVYRQAAVHEDRTAPLYYVVFETPPVPGDGSLSVDDGLETEWFGQQPEVLVNPTVVGDRFEG